MSSVGKGGKGVSLELCAKWGVKESCEGDGDQHGDQRELTQSQRAQREALAQRQRGPVGIVFRFDQTNHRHASDAAQLLW